MLYPCFCHTKEKGLKSLEEREIEERKIREKQEKDKEFLDKRKSICSKEIESAIFGDHRKDLNYLRDHDEDKLGEDGGRKRENRVWRYLKDQKIRRHA